MKEGLGREGAVRSMVLGMFSQGKNEEGLIESSVAEGRVRDIGGTRREQNPGPWCLTGCEKAERQNSRGPTSRLGGGWRPRVLRQVTQEHSRKETEKKRRGGRRAMLDT